MVHQGLLLLPVRPERRPLRLSRPTRPHKELVAALVPSSKAGRIRFAHQTFAWTSEAPAAAVHCIITGFRPGSLHEQSRFHVLDQGTARGTAGQPSTLPGREGPDIFIEKRTSPRSPSPAVHYGSKPADGGHLIVEARTISLRGGSTAAIRAPSAWAVKWCRA